MWDHKCYPIWHPLNMDRFSMAVQHSSHANPCCCRSATFFSTCLNLWHRLHWNLKIKLQTLSWKWMDCSDDIVCIGCMYDLCYEVMQYFKPWFYIYFLKLILILHPANHSFQTMTLTEIQSNTQHQTKRMVGQWNNESAQYKIHTCLCLWILYWHNA